MASLQRVNQIIDSMSSCSSSVITSGSSCSRPILLPTSRPERLSCRTQRLSCCCLPISSFPARPINSSSSWAFPCLAILFSTSSNLGLSRSPFNSTRKPFPVCGLESASEPRGSEADLKGDTEAERGVEVALDATESRSVERGSVDKEARTELGVGKEASLGSRMVEILDLEKQFSFYGAYHNNRVNIFIHILFVWPIFYTSLILWAYTPALAPLPLAAGTLPLQDYMVLNGSFIQAAVYSLYYIALDKKAGSLGALICFGCWIGANAVAQALPWSLSWKIVLASQVTCWFFQVFGHKKFEGRAPALLDNLPQAFLMAPFFVLLECLQTVGYEPYPGFQKRVQKNVDDAIREFKSSKVKKVA